MANLSNINNKFLVTTEGNVGIGTTSPGFRLEVISPTTNVVSRFTSQDNQAWISVRDDGYSTYGALFGCDHDAGLEVILANNAATKRLVIDSSGNVGINRTSIAQPSSGATTLAIQGTSTTKGGSIRLYSSDDSVAAYIP